MSFTIVDGGTIVKMLTDAEVEEAVEALLATMRGLLEAERKADLMLAGKLICQDGLPKEVDLRGSKI